MSLAYRLVQWNRHKIVYDLCLWAGIVCFLGVFIGVSLATTAPPHQVRPEALLLRGLAFTAFFLLTVTLCIGPLHRLIPSTAPLLYNRRHLGVSMFAVSAAHGLLALLYYHGFGAQNPAISLLTNAKPSAAAGPLGLFPFEWFGIASLLILFLMAATSHDFWLKNLGPKTWKRLHILVYAAYAMLVAHIALGYLQRGVGPLPVILLLISVASVVGLQIASRFVRRPSSSKQQNEWVELCRVSDIEPNAAKTVSLPNGTRVAVIRHTRPRKPRKEHPGTTKDREGQEVISCVSNTCRHQGGPLGEGRVIDGCLTCPWHGYQYLPAEGQSPPPFTEKLPTYQVRVVDGGVQVDPQALPEGTRVEPASIGQPIATPPKTTQAPPSNGSDA